jgi:diguanylate cyclase (GGDEF)-like protein/putative nucleotidyltransferase with HDIG domain
MGELPNKAKIYISGTILAGIGIFIWQVKFLDLDFESIWVLIVCLVLGAITQVKKIEGTTARSSYSISWMIFGFAILNLGVPGALLIILVSHVVEWIVHGYPWYIPLFNIANYAIAALCSGFLYEFIHSSIAISALVDVFGIVFAMAVFTLLNHLLVGIVINFARGQNFSESGIFGSLTLIIDYTLLCLGGLSAILFETNTAMVLLPLLPLYLIHKTLKLPALERETQLDAKTGLINTRYFNESLERELERANRFDRPITIVMADLDFLRNINNNYGHIAGDEVLIGIANILKSSFRGYDTVARFGGEEFSILVPEATPEQVFPRIDRIRRTIEETRFEISTSATPISATMSFGIAGRQGQDINMTELVHNADLALYHAKANGRNRAYIFSEEFADEVLNTPKKDKSESSGIVSKPEAIPVDIPSGADQVTQEGVDQTLPEPSPMVELSDEVEEVGFEPAMQFPPLVTIVPKPRWMLNAYILLVGFTALSLLGAFVRFDPDLDWMGLILFAMLVWTTEWFAIEVYDKNTSVSTSAAPYVAGILLFGPIGVFVLSIVIALSALRQIRKSIGRIVFNISNQIIAGMISVGLMLLFKGSILSQPLHVQIALGILTATIVYAITSTLISFAIHLDSGQPAMWVWKERFRWLGPFYAAFGVVAFLFITSYQHAGLLGAVGVLVPLLIVRLSQIQFVERTKVVVNQLKATNIELQQQSKEINTINEELLLVLAGISDLRDPYVVGHSQHVSRYAVLIAEELGLSTERVERVRKAGLLHDIGKLGIAEPILFKPDNLTDDEFEIIKQHVKMGADLLNVCHSLRDLIPFILHHHERFDGKGYPAGLKDGEIPLEARILCLADSVEAMASDRHYHKAMSPEAILEEIQASAGGHFDPNIVKAFTKVVERAGHSVIVNSARRVSAMLASEPQEIPEVVFSVSDGSKTPWRSPNYF